jgi:hypothetical protein
MRFGWHARQEIVAITTFQEKHALLLSFVLGGKKYWVMIERVCIKFIGGFCDCCHLVGRLFTMFSLTA